jgi:hypothetical protein
MKQFLSNILKAHGDKVYHFFCSYTAMLTFTAMDKSMEVENE